MKTIILLAAFIAIFTFSTEVSAQQIRPTLTQAQLLSLQSAGKAPNYILLDVRSAEEYQQGHIANAINISHSALTDNLSKLGKNKDDMIIVYCRSGRRAGIAEALLREQGFTNVKHLAGDMNGWQAKHLPIEQ